MYKKVNNQNGFATILGFFLIALVLGVVGFTAYKVYDSKRITPKTQQQVSQEKEQALSIDTSNWQIKNSTFEGLKGVLHYKVPSDWTVNEDCERLCQSEGRSVNYAILTHGNECIQFSVSSDEKNKTLNGALVSLVTGWNADATAEAKAKKSIQQTSTIPVNAMDGVFASISENGKQYYATIGVLGQDSRFEGMLYRAFLSTCGTEERNTLKAFAGTITVK